jgi:hypothetical protein
MRRFGSATWNGDLRKGKGAVSTESQAMTNHPYTFFSRYGETPGTNPEELLGAANPLPPQYAAGALRLSSRLTWNAMRLRSGRGVQGWCKRRRFQSRQ